MKLTGKHILNAPPARIWTILMDTQSLARVVPGISRLEKISENAYKSTLSIGLGPVSGSFNGHIQLENIIEEKSFTLKAKQESKIGNTNATIGIRLIPAEDAQTAIDESLLQRIARETGGEYFRATDANRLEQIYSRIDRLEKSTFRRTVKEKVQEQFPYVLLAALFFLLLEQILKYTLLRTFP